MINGHLSQGQFVKILHNENELCCHVISALWSNLGVILNNSIRIKLFTSSSICSEFEVVKM